MTNDYPPFADQADNIESITDDELLKRIEYMSEVLFPAIKDELIYITK
jgi:hypothetical protein